jgi:hypothetical protein
MRSRLTAVVLAVCVVLGATVVSAGAKATVPHCFSSQLTLKLVSFQGATGHRLWLFSWRNSSTKCTLRGFPKVVFLDKHGKADTGKVTHGTGFPVKTVTIAHGKRAFFGIEYLDGGFCGGGVKAAHFSFTPPGATAAFKFNPTGANHGTVAFCRGSVTSFPVNSKPAP